MQVDTSQPGPAVKPGRRYTVTPKVLAANRRNLEKANAVPKEIRYRSTPQRVVACRRNLEKARAVCPPAGSARMPSGHRFVRQKLDSLEQCVRRIARRFQAKGPLQKGWAHEVGSLVWGWLVLLRHQCQEERHVLKLLRQWPCTVSNPSTATQLALRVLDVFRERHSLIERCQAYADRLKELGQQDWFDTRPSPSGRPSPAAYQELIQLLAAGLSKLPRRQRRTARDDAPAEVPSGRQECATNTSSNAASGTEGGQAGEAAGPPGHSTGDHEPAKPAEDAQTAGGSPAWPDFDQYEHQVKAALGTRPTLHPIVQEIARLSWEQHQIMEDWVTQAELGLEDLVRPTSTRCPVSEFTAKLEDALKGEAMERLSGEGPRPEQELRTALSKYLFEQYGPHSIFTMVGPPPWVHDRSAEVPSSTLRAQVSGPEVTPASRRPPENDAREKWLAFVRRARPLHAAAAATAIPQPHPAEPVLPTCQAGSTPQAPDRNQ
jgi:hypothetical protein